MRLLDRLRRLTRPVRAHDPYLQWIGRHPDDPRNFRVTGWALVRAGVAGFAGSALAAALGLLPTLGVIVAIYLIYWLIGPAVLGRFDPPDDAPAPDRRIPPRW